jgi:hypothetical protein
VHVGKGDKGCVGGSSCEFPGACLFSGAYCSSPPAKSSNSTSLRPWTSPTASRQPRPCTGPSPPATTSRQTPVPQRPYIIALARDLPRAKNVVRFIYDGATAKTTLGGMKDCKTAKDILAEFYGDPGKKCLEAENRSVSRGSDTSFFADLLGKQVYVYTGSRTRKSM